MRQEPRKLTPIRGAFREVDCTPVAWQMPAPGKEQWVVSLLRRAFIDAVEFTIGWSGIRVKLQVMAEISTESVEERARSVQRLLYAEWQRASREDALEQGELESFRAEHVSMIERSMGRKLQPEQDARSGVSER